MNVGLDLGNTNCRVSCLAAGGSPFLVADHSGSGQLCTPTLAVLDGNCAVVGNLARTLAKAKPESTLVRFSQSSLNAIAGAPPGFDSDPQLVAAIFLKKLRQDVESMGNTIDSAVIAVPSSLNDTGRAALMCAATMADLPLVKMVDEGLAIALSYAHPRAFVGLREAERGDSPLIMVVDFGGTTLKVAIVQSATPAPHVIAETSCMFGGKDIDDRLVQLIRARFDSTNPDLETAITVRGLQDLGRIVEEVKISFTGSEVGYFRRDLLISGTPLNFSLLRSEIEAAAADLFDRVEVEIRHCLMSAGVSMNEIRTVLLAGGSSAFPKYYARIKALSDWTVISQKPESRVCFGAVLSAVETFREFSGLPTNGLKLSPPAISVRTLDPDTGDVKLDKIMSEGGPLECVRREYFKSRSNQSQIVLEFLECRVPDQFSKSLGQITIPVENLPDRCAIEVVYEGFSEGAVRIHISAPRARLNRMREPRFKPAEAGVEPSRISLVRSTMVIS